MGSENSEREAESRRILERVVREAEAGGTSAVTRLARQARDHMGAEDTDKEDWAEYWGTRIGRSLAVLLFAGLSIWLILFLLRG